MIPKTDADTIVILGYWNIQIFRPEWVGGKLLGQDDIKIAYEVPVAPGIPEARFKSATDSLTLKLFDKRLVVEVSKIDDATLTRAEEVARRTLTILHYTPVWAFGVNFRYEEKNPNELLTGLFDSADRRKIAEGGHLIKRTELKHVIELDEFILNTTLAAAEGNFGIHLNFHRKVDSANQAAEELEGKAVTLFEKGIAFLHDVYGCELEVPDGD